jgi:hypothetical protein
VADIALARACPQCGTLVTCSGAFTDEILTGSCTRCGMEGRPCGVEIKNPRYAPPGEKPGPAIDEGKHSPELTNKYWDNTGAVSNAAPFAAGEAPGGGKSNG